MRMQYYFLDLEQWDIIGDSDTILPTDVKGTRRWKAEVGKATYVINIIIDDKFLQ